MNPFRSKNQPDETPGGGPSDAGSAGADGPDETAALIEQLDQQIVRLTAERDEAVAAHKHALADFQNYQRRAWQNEQQAREQATRGVLGSIISVVDHFDMALNQDPAKTTAGAIIAGVTMIKDELLTALTAHGVGIIRPARGDAFDPTRHEAVMQQPGEGVEAGHIVSLARLGYTVNERVVRPAQVIVACS
ncbi:MAG: nucleotide exchange factor GrpE [Phycisphaerales bacterium]